VPLVEVSVRAAWFAKAATVKVSLVLEAV